MRFSSWGKASTESAHSESIELKLRDISQLFNSMDPSPKATVRWRLRIPLAGITMLVHVALLSCSL
jgi:hypothetical protein